MFMASTQGPDTNILEHGTTFRSADVDETHLYAKKLISDHRLIVSGRGFETQINHFDGIDVNFYYAAFLEEEGRLDEAREHARRAVEGEARPDRQASDEALRDEARALQQRL